MNAPVGYDLCEQASQFHVYLPCLGAHLAQCLKCDSTLVGAFNHKKALVGAFSIIVKTLWTFDVSS